MNNDFFDFERALAELLQDAVVFVNCRDYVDLDGSAAQDPTLVIFVIANDIFYWACADAMSVTTSELPDLYERWKADPTWGSVEWCCLKAGMRPQTPMEKAMREAGAWSDALEALPERAPKGCG